jgi:hypothetical protein
MRDLRGNKLPSRMSSASIPLAMTQLQGELGFTGNGSDEGYTKWVAVRQLAVEAAARKLNLPLGHPSEIWLRGGIRLRGTLRLANDVLFIEEKRIFNLALVLDGVTFTYSEIESCVRLD